MNRIKKLTPSLIKRIMKEEKQKIEIELEKESKIERQKLLEQLRLLKRIVEVQKTTNKKSTSVNKLKNKLIKKLRE